MLVKLLEEIFAARDWAEWKALFTEATITFGPIARSNEHLDCAQVAANGFLPEIEGLGIRTVDSPIRIDGEEKRRPQIAPGVGEHSRTVLESFGFDTAVIDALVNAGAVA
jgi:formyl-CoA transferase